MNLHLITRFAADGILNSLFTGMLIALLAWAVTCLVRRQGSGTRFAVWFLALVAIACLPLVGHYAASSGNGISSTPAGVLTLPASFASLLFGAWIIGATLGLLHLAHGLYRLRRLRATCTPINLGEIDPTLQAILVDAQKHRRVMLYTSDAVRVPAAMGYFRPVVVFPAWALAEIPAAELKAILIHELAHLRRWDDWTNLAQKIVKAILFFHPAVWFIESRLSMEREMACDDAVLAADFCPRAYAESLLVLAEKSFLRRGVQLAQAAVGHVQQLKIRIVEILRHDRATSGRVWRPAVALMAAAGMVGVYSVSRGPRLFAFSSNPSHVASVIANSDALSTSTELKSSTEKYSLVATAEQSYRNTAHQVHFDLGQQAVEVGVLGNAGNQVESYRNDGVRGQALHKVNAKFVTGAPQVDGVTHSLSTIDVRPAYRTVPMVQLALLQRGAQLQFVENAIVLPPMMVLSNYAGTQNAATPAAVLFVVQGAQLGVDGPVFWRLTVIHLTQAQQRHFTRGVPNRI